MGHSIYLTNKEIEVVREAINQYEDLVSSDEGSKNETIQNNYSEMHKVLQKLRGK